MRQQRPLLQEDAVVPQTVRHEAEDELAHPCRRRHNGDEDVGVVVWQQGADVVHLVAVTILGVFIIVLC